MGTREGESLKKGDICLIILAVIFLVMWFIPKEQGGEAAIYVDGKIYKRISLEKDSETAVSSEFGENTVLVKNGVVTIVHADCPDKLCVRQGKISKEGETITCLPNKLTVTVYGVENTVELIG